jgi:hypothetical protein
MFADFAGRYSVVKKEQHGQASCPSYEPEGKLKIKKQKSKLQIKN